MLNPLSPTNWLLYSALLGALAVGYFSWQSHERGIGEATVQAKWDKAKAQQEAAARIADAANRLKEQTLQQKVTDAETSAKLREAVLQKAAANALAQSHSMYDQLASLRRQLPGLAEAAVRRYADTASVVLADCQQQYQEVAADADRLSSANQTLEQAWPK